MKRTGRTHALGEIMGTVLPRLDSRRQGQLLLPRVWKQAVGEVFARQTCPRSVIGTVLHVSVSNANWLHEIYFIKSVILGRLRELLPGTPVHDIRFTVDHVPGATDTDDDEPLPELSGSERQRISEQAACIRDEELRSALEAAITAHARNRKADS